MARDLQGDTALHCLARSGGARVARRLLQLDTERGRGLVSLANTAGQTAGHVAASRGHTDFLTVLRDFNDDFSTQDNEGQTPLHLCVMADLTGNATLLKCNVIYLQKSIFSDNLECLKFLLRSCKDVNKKNRDGLAPIHLAVDSNILTMNLLLESGANINLKEDETG